MVNKIISYMNYCRIKEELQESIDKNLKYYGLDKKSRSGLRVVYVVDKNKPHEMLVEFGIVLLCLDKLTPAETVKLIVVLDYASIIIEKANRSYKGYKYEF